MAKISSNNIIFFKYHTLNNSLDPILPLFSCHFEQFSVALSSSSSKLESDKKWTKMQKSDKILKINGGKSLLVVNLHLYN